MTNIYYNEVTLCEVRYLIFNHHHNILLYYNIFDYA